MGCAVWLIHSTGSNVIVCVRYCGVSVFVYLSKANKTKHMNKQLNKQMSNKQTTKYTNKQIAIR